MTIPTFTRDLLERHTYLKLLSYKYFGIILLYCLLLITFSFWIINMLHSFDKLIEFPIHVQFVCSMGMHKKFNLCDRIWCQGNNRCTYAHSRDEKAAWNNELAIVKAGKSKHILCSCSMGRKLYHGMIFTHGCTRS